MKYEPGTPRRSSVVLIGVLGALAVTVMAVWFKMSARDALRLAAILGLPAILVGLCGVAVLYALRGRAMGVQLTVVALASVAAVGAGAIAAAQAMFISKHDLDTFVVILLAAATVGGVIALILGRRVSAAGRWLGEETRRIGGGDLTAMSARPTTGEFAALARELDVMARRLHEARQHERALEASRRELTAWVSHDLRTPLAGIKAMVEALEDGVAYDSETVGRYYRSLRIETDRLARLVDELFELSVISAGALRLQMQRVSLGDLVSEAISAATASAQARGVRLEGQLNGAGPAIDISPFHVARVVQNLLDNAVQRTPSHGTVWLETGQDGDDAYVTVTDECGGIPDRVMRRVFDPAFRGEPARTPESNGGAGLGLAIARGIVEAHLGSLTVRNAGTGCRFTVRLPLSRSAR